VIAAWAARVVDAEPRGGRESRYLDRLGMHALEAGLEAAARANAPAGPRTGVFAGVGGLEPRWDEIEPALRQQRDDGQDAWARGLSRLHPFFMLRHLSNGQQALLAARLAATGDGACFGGATAGAQALSSALRALEAGALDHAIVIASGEGAAAAVVLGAAGVASVDAASGVDPIADGEPRPAFVGEFASRLSRGGRVVEGASLGPATALLQIIAWIGKLETGDAVVAPSWGAPGLVAAVRLEIA
jgi:hypothetical protein